ncbi:MAG: hypothetical protein EOP54_14785 [Sphingobacteriales bacterium]|nr:MAG: hypothetical protein EOP54_14785 [Sphingobacteriales bacterium]
MKKNTKKLILPFSLLTIGYGQVAAQDLSSSYTPNLFLGTLDVNIPLYEQNGIGVNLNYNTKGIPVREMAGVAGLHWNLQAGGMIYRKINGIPDEYRYKPTFLPGDFLDTQHEAIAGKYSDYIGRLYEPLIPATNNIFTDSESDEYTFSVGSKNFNFYFGRNGKIFTNPKGNFEVYLFRDNSYRKPDDLSSLADYTIYSLNIKVVDQEEDKQYYFSPSVRTDVMLTEYFLDPTLNFQASNVGGFYFNTISDEFPEQWKLDSVVSPGNRVTKFSYEIFEISSQAVQDSSWIGQVFTGYVQPVISTAAKKSKFYQVKSIEYPNRVKLNFLYNSSTRRNDIDPNNSSSDRYPFLEEVNVQQGDQSIRYIFDYAYYYSGLPPNYEVPLNHINTDGHADMYSLKLKGITQYSADGTENFSMYRFQYLNKKQRRFGANLDLYGYYNDGNPSFFNRTDHSILNVSNSGGIPVKTSSVAASWGLLNSIENGYGGKVEFKYGIHSGLSTVASQLQSSNANLANPAGLSDGVRIDSIIRTDEHNPSKRDVIHFEYSQGQQFLAGGFCSDYLTAYNSIGRLSYIAETFISPNLLFQGSNHGYGVVNMVTRNKSQELLSRTEYTFSNFKDGSGAAKVLVTGGGQMAIEPPFFTSKQRIKEWEIGLPISIKHFDNKNLLISETSNEYISKLDTTTARSIQLTEFNRRVSLEAGYLFYAAESQGIGSGRPYDIRKFVEIKDPYIPYRGKSFLTKTVNRTYESNSLTKVDSILYRYDERDNQKYSYARNSRGELIRFVNIYNYDLAPSTITGNATLSDLQVNQRELLVGTERWKSPTSASLPQGLEPVIGSDRLIDATMFIYKLLPNRVLATQSVSKLESENSIPANIYKEGMLDVGSPNYLPYSQVTKAWMNQTSDVIVPSTEAQLFDAQGNVSQAYIPSSDKYKVNIFDPINLNKIVEIANAKKNEVAFADFDHYAIAGNLVYNGNHIVRLGSTILPVDPPPSISGISSCISGRAYLAIAAAGSTAKQVYTSGLPVGKEYRATFWASDHGMPQFGIEGGTQYNLVHIATKGRFKQYEALFFLAPGQENARIGINSPVNIALEDIRICPSNATMQNWTYAPLFGIASTTDILGRLTYMEYDKMGRLVITRDQEGNILEKNVYDAN